MAPRYCHLVMAVSNDKATPPAGCRIGGWPRDFLKNRPFTHAVTAATSGSVEGHLQSGEHALEGTAERARVYRVQTLTHGRIRRRADTPQVPATMKKRPLSYCFSGKSLRKDFLPAP